MKTEREFTLFDYFADSSDSASNVFFAPQMPTVESTAAGSKSYAYDVGDELKGARKHLASLTKFSAEWYEALEIDPTQAFEEICKKELAGDFSPEELREQGFSSEAAYAIKMMWDRVPQRPEDDPKQREYFIQAINRLKDIFAQAKTEVEFRLAFDRLKEAVVKSTHSFRESAVKLDPSLMDYRFWNSLGDRFKYTFFGRRGKVAAGYHQIFSKAFESEIGRNWRWAAPKTRVASDKQSNSRWERLVPEEVVRLSKEVSGVSKPEDLMEHYGYRGVQFGNWVDDQAGRYHVLCCGNAHADLATVLGLPRKSLSFYGRLGIAFGARGSGKASAHFEPDQNVFNFTKHRGGGSNAHEWAHALDFNLYSLSHGFTNGKQAAVSCNKPGDKIPQAVTRAFEKLMSAIKDGNGLLEVKVPDPLPQVGQYKSIIYSVLERNGYDISKAFSELKRKYRVKARQWNEIGFAYCRLLAEQSREVPDSFFVPTDYSSFYLDAKARGAYWSRDYELFARAFESWIEDELAERGMTNSYLVCGTRFGGPYPQGVERETINSAFRSWWKVLLDSGILQDEQLWNMNNHI